MAPRTFGCKKCFEKKPLKNSFVCACGFRVCKICIIDIILRESSFNCIKCDANYLDIIKDMSKVFIKMFLKCVEQSYSYLFRQQSRDKISYQIRVNEEICKIFPEALHYMQKFDNFVKNNGMFLYSFQVLNNGCMFFIDRKNVLNLLQDDVLKELKGVYNMYLLVVVAADSRQLAISSADKLQAGKYKPDYFVDCDADFYKYIVNHLDTVGKLVIDDYVIYVEADKYDGHWRFGMLVPQTDQTIAKSYVGGKLVSCEVLAPDDEDYDIYLTPAQEERCRTVLAGEGSWSDLNDIFMPIMSSRYK